MIYPGEQRGKKFYIENLKVESEEQLKFLRKAIENHEKNARKWQRELDDENAAIRELQNQVEGVKGKLKDDDAQVVKMLIKDFKSDINRILNGEDSKPGARYGLSVQKQGPYRINKPVSVSQDGKRITETREILVTKCRSNEEALERFQGYLRGGYNLPVDGLTFNEVQESIEDFFKNAPKPDVYGAEYEIENPIAEPAGPISQDNLFKQFDSFRERI